MSATSMQTLLVLLASTAFLMTMYAALYYRDPANPHPHHNTATSIQLLILLATISAAMLLAIWYVSSNTLTVQENNEMPRSKSTPPAAPTPGPAVLRILDVIDSYTRTSVGLSALSNARYEIDRIVQMRGQHYPQSTHVLQAISGALYDAISRGSAGAYNDNLIIMCDSGDRGLC